MKSIIKISPFSYLLLNKGFIRADKLENNLEINSLGDKEFIKDLSRIEEENCYWLTLQNGNSLIISENNLVCTINGWVKVSELKPNDLILNKFYQEEKIEGNLKINWTNKLENNALPINVPEFNSLELSEWLGIILNNASFSEKTGIISLPTENLELIERVSFLTSKIFNVSWNKLEDSRGNRKPIYTINSMNLSRFLESYLGPNFNLRKVPGFILEGSTLEQEAFVTGLSMGAYKHKSELIVYSGVSKIVAEFAQHVLRNQGYLVNLYMKTMPLENKQPYYYLSILGVTPFLKRKILTKHDFIHAKSSNYIVPFNEDLSALKIPTIHPNYHAFAKLKQRKQKYARYDIVKNLELNHDKNLYVSQVRSNTFLGPKALVGIESNLAEEIVFNHIILA